MSIKSLFQELRAESKKDSISEIDFVRHDKVLQQAKNAIKMAKEEINQLKKTKYEIELDKDSIYNENIQQAYRTIESAKDIIIYEQSEQIHILQKKLEKLENNKAQKSNSLNEEKFTLLEKRISKLENYFENSKNNINIVSEPSSQNISFVSNNIEPENQTTNELAQRIENVSEIVELLSQKGIKIKTLPEKNESDHIINQLSVFLGDRYDSLKILYGKIKRNMQRGGSFFLDLKNEPQKVIADMTQFSTNLHRIAFLEQYSYQKSPHFMLRAKTTDLPKAQNFFSGQWLERFVLEKIHSIVQEFELDFNYMINPQIILPNGDDFELDIFCRIENKFFWIEAKTGDYQQHIQKYSRISKIMGLEPEHSMMILLDINQDTANTLTNLFNMRVIPVDQFEEALKNLIEKLFENLITIKKEEEIKNIETD
jgi:hypothetical protein